MANFAKDILSAEFTMNIQYINRIENNIEELLKEITNTPINAEVFAAKNKVEWIAELKAQLDSLKQIKKGLSREWYEGLRL